MDGLDDDDDGTVVVVVVVVVEAEVEDMVDVADEVDADAEVDVASTTRNIPLPELQQIIAAVEASTAMKGRRHRRHVVLRFIMKYSNDK